MTHNITGYSKKKEYYQGIACIRYFKGLYGLVRDRVIPSEEETANKKATKNQSRRVAKRARDAYKRQMASIELDGAPAAASTPEPKKETIKEAVTRINRAADLLLDQMVDHEEEVPFEAGDPIQADEDAIISLAEQEAMQGDPIVRLVRIEEEPEVMEVEEPVPEEEPVQAQVGQVHESPISEANSSHGNGINDYARLMVTAEPMSVSTSSVGDGKRIKTYVYRRRSLSLE